MSIIISSKLSKNKAKIRHYFEWGKGTGQRISTGIFTYKNPKNSIEKNHNKESLQMLETKKSQLILDKQSIRSGYIPNHKIKTNFLDYYLEYAKTNARFGSRHLASSLTQFKLFINKHYISAIEITESLCENFRAFLLNKFNGETPANYFREFKRMMRTAKKSGYFLENPCEDLACKTKPNRIKKSVIEPDEYLQLIIVLVQHKTEVTIPLHAIAKMVIGEKKMGWYLIYLRPMVLIKF